jgi:hypothetical protein
MLKKILFVISIWSMCMQAGDDSLALPSESPFRGAMFPEPETKIFYLRDKTDDSTEPLMSLVVKDLTRQGNKKLKDVFSEKNVEAYNNMYEHLRGGVWTGVKQSTKGPKVLRVATLNQGEKYVSFKGIEKDFGQKFENIYPSVLVFSFSRDKYRMIGSAGDQFLKQARELHLFLSAARYVALSRKVIIQIDTLSDQLIVKSVSSDLERLGVQMFLNLPPRQDHFTARLKYTDILDTIKKDAYMQLENVAEAMYLEKHPQRTGSLSGPEMPEHEQPQFNPQPICDIMDAIGNLDGEKFIQGHKDFMNNATIGFKKVIEEQKDHINTLTKEIYANNQLIVSQRRDLQKYAADRKKFEKILASLQSENEKNRINLEKPPQRTETGELSVVGMARLLNRGITDDQELIQKQVDQIKDLNQKLTTQATNITEFKEIIKGFQGENEKNKVDTERLKESMIEIKENNNAMKNQQSFIFRLKCGIGLAGILIIGLLIWIKQLGAAKQLVI